MPIFRTWAFTNAALSGCPCACPPVSLRACAMLLRQVTTAVRASAIVFEHMSFLVKIQRRARPAAVPLSLSSEYLPIGCVYGFQRKLLYNESFVTTYTPATAPSPLMVKGSVPPRPPGGSIVAKVPRAEREKPCCTLFASMNHPVTAPNKLIE